MLTKLLDKPDAGTYGPSVVIRKLSTLILMADKAS
jgi:hypothetical protein